MSLFGSNRYYFDYASGTPLAFGVFLKMLPHFVWRFANPGSLYTEGIMEKRVLEASRKRLASHLGIQAGEVYFTGSGTEANNLIIQGAVTRFREKYPDRTPHIVTTEIEHSSVLRVYQALQKWGVRVTYVEPNETGSIRAQRVFDAITEDTVLVSVQSVNNEIGTILPVAHIGRMIKSYRKEKNREYPFFHSDASQAVNTLSVRLDTLFVDAITLDSSKCYGPKGFGVLAMRRNVNISPIMFGGGQENGLRPATENLAQIVGGVEAIVSAMIRRKEEHERLKKIQDAFEKGIRELFPQAKISAEGTERSPHISNVCFPGIDNEFLVLKLDRRGFAVSSASTCMNTEEESYSYVVKAVLPGCEASSLRISFGRKTRKAQLKKMLAALKNVVE